MGRGRVRASKKTPSSKAREIRKHPLLLLNACNRLHSFKCAVPFFVLFSKPSETSKNFNTRIEHF